MGEKKLPDSHYDVAQTFSRGWVNDEHTRRACERSDDAYSVFHKMLEHVHPPDD
jgi:hypothetical protein